MFLRPSPKTGKPEIARWFKPTDGATLASLVLWEGWLLKNTARVDPVLRDLALLPPQFFDLQTYRPTGALVEGARESLKLVQF